MISEYFINKRNREILDFLKDDKNFLIHYLSIYGQLDFQQINKLQSILDFYSTDLEHDDDGSFWPPTNGLSNNTSVRWSLELIDQFKDKWNWKHLSRNVSLNWWSETLLKYFEDKWDWIELSDNKNLNLNINLINKFKTKWNWESSNGFSDTSNEFWRSRLVTGKSGICGNQSINWDYEKIKKFEDLIDWPALSLNPNISFNCIGVPDKNYCRPYISYFSNLDDSGYYTHTSINSLLSIFKNWDFKNLSFNSGIGRNLYFHNGDQVVAFLNNYDFNWTGISENSSIPWSDYLIGTLKDLIDWKSFSKLIPESNYIGYFAWSIDFIEKYKGKLDWTTLSGNPSLPWSLDLINRYKDMWDWKKISRNRGIPWSKSILSKFENNLNWDLSKYDLDLLSIVPWDQKLIRKFKDKIDWRKISRSKRVNWSLPMMKKHYKNREIKLEDIFRSELETPLTWKFYKFYLKDHMNDSSVLLENNHFCENIIKPILTGENYETVLTNYLDRFYYYSRDRVNEIDLYSLISGYHK